MLDRREYAVLSMVVGALLIVGPLVLGGRFLHGRTLNVLERLDAR